LIYKYYSINKNVISSILNNSFWFSKPKDYNDPFDSFTPVEFYGNTNQWIEFVKNNSNYTKEKKSKIIEIMKNYKNLSNKSHIDLLTEKRIKDAYCICCFSKCNDNILMWSHYSNNHKGICIGYKTEKINNKELLRFNDPRISNYIRINRKQYLPINNVKYSIKMRKPFNPLYDSEDIWKNYFLHKCKDWSYEKEVRIIQPFESIQNICYHRDIINEIIVGCKITNEDEKLIKRLIKIKNEESDSKINVIKLKMRREKYKLQRIGIDDL